MRKQQGVTLVELMIVVAIIAVIATVGYPMYTEQMQKSRRSDARAALSTIVMAQERYFTVNNRYTANLGSLSIDSTLQGGSSSEAFYSLAVTAATTSFSVTATGRGKQLDDACRSMTIDGLGVRSAADKNGTSITDTCW